MRPWARWSRSDRRPRRDAFHHGMRALQPRHAESRKLWGHSPAGLFGYSHLLGGYPGGQAEYLRVPFADVGPIKVPAGLPDEHVLFLSDIFPTGYMAASSAISRMVTPSPFGAAARRASLLSAAPFYWAPGE